MSRSAGLTTFTLLLATALLLAPLRDVAEAKASNGLTKSDYAMMLAKKYNKNKYVPKNTKKMSSENIYKEMLKAMEADGIRFLKPDMGNTPLTKMEFIDFTYSFLTHKMGENGMERKYFLKAEGIVDKNDIGIIKSFEGEASFERHVTKKVVPVTGNEPVLFKDIAETSEESRMELQFDDQSILTLGEETSLEVNEMIFDPKKNTRKTIIKVAYGKIRVEASKLGAARNDLEIVTPTAVIGVRGTEFVVSVGKDGATEVVTLSGLVAVRSGRDDKTEVLLKADMATSVAASGKISKPKKISEKKKKEVVENTKVKNPKKVAGGGNVTSQEVRTALNIQGKSNAGKSSEKGDKERGKSGGDNKGQSAERGNSDKERGNSANSGDKNDDKERGRSGEHGNANSDNNNDLAASIEDDDDKVYTVALSTIADAGRNEVSRGDLWETINNALDSADIRDRQGALEQIADAQAGRTLKDANGYWVRSQQYLLRPDEKTAEVVAVNYRSSDAEDLSGITVMDWTTTFAETLPSGSALRDLPWDDYLTVNRDGDPYVNNSSDYTLDNMIVEFTFDTDSIKEARTFGSLSSSRQDIDRETLSVNASNFKYDESGGKNTYSIGSISGGFSYDMAGPKDNSVIEVKTYVVGDADGTDNTGEISGIDKLEITDLWTALAVNTTTGVDIGSNNLELAFSNGTSDKDLMDGTIDLVYVPIPRMELP
jgi:hypothetical protein